MKPELKAYRLVNDEGEYEDGVYRTWQDPAAAAGGALGMHEARFGIDEILQRESDGQRPGSITRRTVWPAPNA